MLWSNKIYHWKNGIIPTHDCNIRFLFETSPIDSNMENEYEERLIPHNILNKYNVQNYSSFKEQLSNSTNRDITVFPNLSNSTLLCVPMPRKGKNFTTIKDFIDNASMNHQRAFWKQVALEIEQQLLTNETLYISTHGLDVPYFHLRIEPVPKYYITKEFIV
jgi:hypothetical protein